MRLCGLTGWTADCSFHLCVCDFTWRGNWALTASIKLPCMDHADLMAACYCTGKPRAAAEIRRVDLTPTWKHSDFLVLINWFYYRDLPSCFKVTGNLHSFTLVCFSWLSTSFGLVRSYLPGSVVPKHFLPCHALETNRKNWRTGTLIRSLHF